MPALSELDRPKPLAELLAPGAVWQLVESLRFVRLVAQQVQALHIAGQLHRAISIHTVHVGRDGAPWLLPPPEKHTLGGDEFDPDGCPPELATCAAVELPAELATASAALQAGGHEWDPRRIDVYQVGGLLCRLLTGEPVQAYLYSPSVKARVPAPVRTVLDHALGFDTSDRFTNCEQFIEADDAAVQAVSNATKHDTTLVVSDGTHSGIVARHDVPLTGAARPSAAEVETLPFAQLGNCRILGRLGQGGMGDVYKAHDESLDRLVAIKVLPPQLARDGDFVQRFRAEASAVAKLVHPNIVQVHSIGEEQGHHFFVMQFVEGESLAERLHRERRLDVHQALAIVEQCLTGLEAAHEAGLVHRDVKPANILLDSRSGGALLADFGLVKRAGSQTGMTATGVIMGTVDYLSPEQGRGLAVDARSDLYSIGVLLFELLSGSLPFRANTPTAMIFQHAYEQPRPLHDALPGVSPALEQIVGHLLLKDPNERYQTARTVRDDLAAFREGRSVTEFTASVAAAAPTRRPPMSAAAARSFSDFTKASGRRPRLRQRLRGLFNAHAPEFIKELQGTTQQVDGAVAEYELRREKLARLHVEARRLAKELDAQVVALRSAVVGGHDGAADDQLAALVAQSAEQHAQVGDLEAQLAKADATLAQLHSQRDLLEARLKAAQSQMRIEDGGIRRPRQWRVVAGTLAAVAVAIAAVGLILAFRRMPETAAVVIAPQDGAKASTPASATRTPAADTRDLLALIDPKRDAVQGDWRFDDDDLVAPVTHNARLQVPFTPPDEYELTCVATGGQVDIGLVVGGRQVMLAVGGSGGGVNGLQLVDGLGADRNVTTHRDSVLRVGRPNTIHCVVRKTSIDVECNGEPFLHWNGDPSTLSLPPQWQVPNSKQFFLYCWEDPYRIHKLALTPSVPPPADADWHRLASQLNGFDEWSLDRGNWSAVGGAFHGVGNSLMTFRHKLPRDFALEFTLTVVSGMRVRIELVGTNLFFGDENASNNLWLYGPGHQMNVVGQPWAYEIGKPIKIGISFEGDKFLFEVEGRAAVYGRRFAIGPVGLAMQSGDDFSPGTIEARDFVVGPPPSLRTRCVTRYSNGSLRQYEFGADGGVRFFYPNSRPGRLQRRGQDWLLDFDDGKIDRLTLAGERLFVEHWPVAKDYPANDPLLIGVSVGANGVASAKKAMHISESPSAPAAAGKWEHPGKYSIRYVTGACREYVFAPDGTVTDESDPAKRRGRVRVQGSDWLLDFNDGKIERLSPAGTRLFVEHFDPATSFPEGPPSLFGIGVQGSLAPAEKQSNSGKLSEAPILPVPTPHEQELVDSWGEEIRRMLVDRPSGGLHAAETAPTSAAYARQLLAATREAYMAAYQQASRHDKAWDSQAAALVEQFGAARNASPEQRALGPAVSALITAGCDDPLVLYADAKIKVGGGDQADLQAALPRAQAAVTGFAGSKYPAKVAARASLLCAEILGYRPGEVSPVEREAHCRRAVELLVAATEEELTGVERRGLLNRVERELQQGIEGLLPVLVSQLVASERADPWIKAILVGREQIRLGWKARGEGYANSVTPQGMAEFSARLKRARVELIGAWRMHPEFPEATVELIRITMAVGGVAGDDPRFWFDRAVEAELDYSPAYDSLRWSLRPRWGGSHKSMLAFGRECLATRRFELNVPWQFHLVLTEIASELDDPHVVYREPGVYDDYRELVAGYCASDVYATQSHRFRTRLACVAWLSGASADTRKILADLGDDVVPAVVAEFHTTLDELLGSTDDANATDQ